MLRTPGAMQVPGQPVSNAVAGEQCRIGAHVAQVLRACGSKASREVVAGGRYHGEPPTTSADVLLHQVCPCSGTSKAAMQPIVAEAAQDWRAQDRIVVLTVEPDLVGGTVMQPAAISHRAICQC